LENFITVCFPPTIYTFKSHLSFKKNLIWPFFTYFTISLIFTPNFLFKKCVLYLLSSLPCSSFSWSLNVCLSSLLTPLHPQRLLNFLVLLISCIDLGPGQCSCYHFLPNDPPSLNASWQSPT
jgi:hypothetical protein